MYPPITTSDQLGQILAAGRRRAGLTQAQAAARVGLSQSRISALEADAGAISLRQLLALFGAYQLQLRVADPTDRPVSDWLDDAGNTPEW